VPAAGCGLTNEATSNQLDPVVLRLWKLQKILDRESCAGRANGMNAHRVTPELDPSEAAGFHR
jgi:hypothetical protein